ncbi:MAG: hypothetical protein D6782_03445, partial [Alphaproteobacteria bacterium]
PRRLGERRMRTDLFGLWAILRTPARARALRPQQWTALVRLARREFVLGRLAAALKADDGLWRGLPDKARQILDSALCDVIHHQRQLMWETTCLARALDGLGVPVVLLKGAAYLGDGLAAAVGRVAADLDILVPAARLRLVEDALIANGWAAEPKDPYDEHYYRAWMHELPPFRHRERGTVIDVHHAILPLTARPKPPTALLMDAAVSCGETGFARLGDCDLFIHAATHLFHDGEFVTAFRNLVELHDLLEELGPRPGFYDRLLARADALGLARYAAYGLRYSHRLLGSRVPPPVLADARRHLPAPPVLALMDRLVAGAVMGARVPRGKPRLLWAQRMLYMRAHWLRMPPAMLARHLAIKAFKRAR